MRFNQPGGLPIIIAGGEGYLGIFEKIERLLIENEVSPQTIDFLRGFLAAKPKRWTWIFYHRYRGLTQAQIAQKEKCSRESVSKVLKKIKTAINVNL